MVPFLHRFKVNRSDQICKILPSEKEMVFRILRNLNGIR